MVERKYEPKFYNKKELSKKSGIYQIRNLINNKVYVGSSSNLRTRMNAHFNELNKNKHHSIYLQNAFNKYGEQNFVFEVIEFVKNKDNLIESEQYWINKLDSVSSGYNIQPIAGKPSVTDRLRQAVIESNKRRVHTEEQNKAHSIRMSGTGNPMYGVRGKDAPSSCKVICIEENKAFYCVKDAELYYNLYKNGVTRCLMGIRKTCGNFHWIRYKDYKGDKSKLTWIISP